MKKENNKKRERGFKKTYMRKGVKEEKQRKYKYYENEMFYFSSNSTF